MAQRGDKHAVDAEAVHLGGRLTARAAHAEAEDVFRVDVTANDVGGGPTEADRGRCALREDV